VDFTLPRKEYGTWWSVLIDTADDGTWASDSGDTFGPGDVVVASPRSTIVLRRPVEVDPTAALTAAATQDPTTPSAARAARAGGPGGNEPPQQAAAPSSGSGTSSGSGKAPLPSPRPALRRGDDGGSA